MGIKALTTLQIVACLNIYSTGLWVGNITVWRLMWDLCHGI